MVKQTKNEGDGMTEEFPPWPGTKPKYAEQRLQQPFVDEEDAFEEEYVIKAKQNGTCKVKYEEPVSCEHEGYYSFDQVKALVHKARNKGLVEGIDQTRFTNLNQAVTILITGITSFFIGAVTLFFLVRQGVIIA